MVKIDQFYSLANFIFDLVEGFVLSNWRDSTTGSEAADDGTVSHLTYLSHTLGSDRVEFEIGLL